MSHVDVSKLNKMPSGFRETAPAQSYGSAIVSRHTNGNAFLDARAQEPRQAAAVAYKAPTL